jgi:hypothetical protein
MDFDETLVACFLGGNFGFWEYEKRFRGKVSENTA